MNILTYAEIEIIGDIKTKQRPRATVIGGHARVYTPKDTIYYENYIKTLFIEKYPDSNFDNLPLAIHIECYFKLNQEQMKYKYAEGIPCKSKKDLDNIAKIVLDSLNGVAFNDDKQITSLRVEKCYTREEEKIVVEIMDSTRNFNFYSLKHLKDVFRMQELQEKIEKLSLFEKLNKADSERLKKYENEYAELKEKVSNRGNYLND